MARPNYQDSVAGLEAPEDFSVFYPGATTYPTRKGFLTHEILEADIED